jgi:hypothetical protein
VGGRARNPQASVLNSYEGLNDIRICLRCMRFAHGSGLCEFCLASERVCAFWRELGSSNSAEEHQRCFRLATAQLRIMQRLLQADERQPPRQVRRRLMARGRDM